MLYMVVETFRPGQVRALYLRFEERGRLMPDGLHYVNSWIDEGIQRCWQVMECEDPTLLQQWIGNWSDLADFEVIPVLTSPQARARVAAMP
jgi:hypothetical protein